MPPYRPDHELTTSLDSMIQEAKDRDTIVKSHMPAHAAVVKRAEDIMEAHGNKVKGKSSSQPLKTTDWYENPKLREGDRRVAYQLRQGISTSFYGRADPELFALCVRVSEPHPIYQNEEMSYEKAIAYIGKDVTHILGEAAASSKGVCTSLKGKGGGYPEALAPGYAEFEDVLDTLKFITTSAVAAKTLGPAATSQAVSL